MPENDFWIKRVEIRNFQSHKNTNIDFTKGTNALIGSSNSGKSAVIRAIRWCLINTPSGTDFITVGENEAKVKVFLSNGKIIERRRNRGSVNVYVLYEGEEILGEYTGFGSKVPQEIAEAHGITPIANNIYFQFAHQLEAPFMLSLTPSKRADLLGDLEELSRIDTALTGVNDDIRLYKKEKVNLEKEEKALALEYDKLNRKISFFKERIEKLKSLKVSIKNKASLYEYLSNLYGYLKEIDEKLADLEKEKNKIDQALSAWPNDLEERVNKYQVLETNYNRLVEIDKELASMKVVDKQRVLAIEKVMDSLGEKIDMYKKLAQIYEELKKNDETIESIRSQHAKIKKIETIDFDSLDTKIDQFKVLSAEYKRLTTIDENISEAREQIKSASQQMDEELNEFVEALQHEQVCPTCGRETDSVCVDHVMKVI
jgi:DNA repair protein SbcC/Rad50